ncbi:MAG TPA: permease-like cell division protein FtsX [Candidatus Agrococcus pullicola]|uniref:Cell division protein FtsX n=1 Tax=Candidatus Agrococcus pullicola TaxID=2838429 RepID=A0A9D1YT22_9MICO|nr:permease-like cell division protein FtsX [Candidatus Agrococcus pullicola]
MRAALVLREVWTGLRRNMSMVISVILVTFISLTFVGSAMLLQSQINQMKGFWYDRAQVAIYFCNDGDTGDQCAGEATEEDIAAVEAVLESEAIEPFVRNFEFEDRPQALENFQRQFAGTQAVEFATEDSMSRALRVQPSSPADASVVAEATRSMPGVLEVQDQRRLLEPIFNALNIASLAAVVIAAIMLVAAVLLISTTIRLSAYSRQRELGIMRLVGASNRFIQTPFILEGVIAALIGSLLASGAILALVQWGVQGYLAPALPTYPLVTVDAALLVVPVLLAIGVALSAIAAAVAIRRYLRV